MMRASCCVVLASQGDLGHALSVHHSEPTIPHRLQEMEPCAAYSVAQVNSQCYHNAWQLLTTSRILRERGLA